MFLRPLFRCTSWSSHSSVASISLSYSTLAPPATPIKPKRTLPKNRKRPPLPPLVPSDLQITYVRGSGPGGQVINKSSISCSIIHIPTGLRVQCHQTRSRETNRLLGIRILQGKLDQLWNPGTSQAEQKWERESKKKASRARKRKRKEAGVSGEEDEDAIEGKEDDKDDEEEEEEDKNGELQHTVESKGK